MRFNKIWILLLLLIGIGFYFLPRINFSCIEGDCYSGEGVYTYNNSYYYGSFRNGYRHGYGMEKYPGGCTYYGFFENGHKQFYGSYVCEKDGFSFTTYWNHGGHYGNVVYSCGSKSYSGKWGGIEHTLICVSGNCDAGTGKAIFPFKKLIYEGEFKEGHLNGIGSEVNACTGELLYKGRFKHSHKEQDFDEKIHQQVPGIIY